MIAKKTNTGSFKSKLWITIGILIVLLLGGTAFNYYMTYFSPNVTAKQEYLYISTGSDFDAVYTTIKEGEMVKDTSSFLSAAVNMDYPQKVKAGKYRMTEGMNNRSLINMLKAGKSHFIM
jgi:UPF0755 protein